MELGQQGTSMAMVTYEQKIKACKVLKDQIITAMMLVLANNGYFGQMKDDLVNDFAKGNNTYPHTPDVLILLINLYKTCSQKKQFSVLNEASDSVTCAPATNDEDKKSETKAEKKRHLTGRVH